MTVDELPDQGTTAFPPAWIINLADSTERRDFMVSQLGDTPLHYEFVEAVDGRALTGEQMRLYSEFRARWTFGRRMTLGEIGCALSHVLLYERMVSENVQEVLILEDDIAVTPDLFALLRRRGSFPASWQVVNFDVRQFTVFGNCRAFVRPFGEPVYKDYQLAIFQRSSSGSGAYLLTQAGASALLEHAWPIRVPSDLLLGRPDMSRARVYAIYPPPVQHGSFKSERGRITTFRVPRNWRRARFMHPGFCYVAVRKELSFLWHRAKLRLAELVGRV